MTRHRNPTEEEIRVATDRAKSHYFDQIQHQLTEADKGRYVAIDGKSLEWEIGDTDDISEVLRSRVPDAVIFQLRHIIMVSEYIGAVPAEFEQIIRDEEQRLRADRIGFPTHQLADRREEFGR